MRLPIGTSGISRVAVPGVVVPRPVRDNAARPSPSGETAREAVPRIDLVAMRENWAPGHD